MNVLEAVHTDGEWGDCILWSTQEPCSMCSAAAAFVGVGELPHIAPDPWAIVAQAEDPGVEASKLLRSVGPAEDEWLVSSNVFLPAERGDQEGRRHAGAGAQPGTRAGDRRHRRRSPPARSECEIWTSGHAADEALADIWPRIVTAAGARRRLR